MGTVKVGDIFRLLLGFDWLVRYVRIEVIDVFKHSLSDGNL